MKRLIIALLAASGLSAAISQSASAADLVRKAPLSNASPAVAGHNWTGCYLGGHLGSGWSKKQWSVEFFGKFDLGTDDMNGVVGGVQAGCDYQFSPVVVGVEADFSWADIWGRHNAPVTWDPDEVLTSKVDRLGAITGRVGYAWDRVLLYGKGGAAWAHDKYTWSETTVHAADASHTRWGWAIGAGLEFALAPSWSLKVEYNRLDFGTDTVLFNCTGPGCGPSGISADIDQRIQTVKLGVNYRFGVGPGSAR